MPTIPVLMTIEVCFSHLKKEAIYVWIMLFFSATNVGITKHSIKFTQQGLRNSLSLSGIPPKSSFFLLFNIKGFAF